MSTVDLLRSELAVLFRRTRSIAMLAALAAIPVLVAVAVRLSSHDGGPSFLGAITTNGLFVGIAATILSTPLFLPLVVGVVAGDTIAGEASVGTLRYLLVVPAGRARLLVVKLLGAVAFAIAGPLVVVVSGSVAGAILFPVGPITLLSGDQVSLAAGLGRLALVALYTAVSLVGLTAIGLFLSTLTDVPVGAMAGTVVIAVASQVLDALPQLDAIHPFLLTDPWLGVAAMLRDPIDWSSFGTDALVQGCYLVVFGLAAFARFTSKDVLA